MSKESDFVDLLHREMEALQKWCQGKEEPKTAVGCQELVEPFIYQIGKLKADNYIKDQRIAELEEQLKNAIVPKFKIGQEVYVIFDRTLWGERMVEIVSAKIIGIIATTKIQYMFSNLAAWYKEENVFATKEEAEAKLKELGENDVKD